jgi:choline dehydrogenase
MTDVLVVGGGAAGCALAARLAESRTVVLLEAGPDLRSESTDEMRDGWQITPALFDWGFTAARTERPVRRTKGLGGTSWLTRFAPRGAPADYDAWPAGWSFDDVLPYFMRLESDLEYGNDPWHGDRGPMPSTRYPDLERTELLLAAERAVERAGIPRIDDHNRPGAVGLGPMPMSSTAGRRVTTAGAYLPVGGTPDTLAIRCGGEASRIVFDGDSARGAELTDGEVVEADTVVLCAGVYGSPVILMRSGIGPADELRAVGIDVRADLPAVGDNLADHPVVDLVFELDGEARSGPILHTLATFHSSRARADDAPDLAFWLSDPEGEPPEFGIGVVLTKPECRGSVRLRSVDPADPPLIELPVPVDGDVERLVECYERALDVLADPEVAAFGSVPRPDDARAEVIATMRSLPHVVGTCALGTVVDERCRVRGVDHLYVADASVMPDVPSGFVHFPTIMIAERTADLLLGA